MRAGWRNESRVAAAVALLAAGVGAAWVGLVHGGGGGGGVVVVGVVGVFVVGGGVCSDVMSSDSRAGVRGEREQRTCEHGDVLMSRLTLQYRA